MKKTTVSNEQKVKDYLHNVYGESFDVKLTNEVDMVQPRYEFAAWPASSPRYRFEVTMNKNNGAILDNYIGRVWTYQASDELRTHAAKQFDKVALVVKPRLAYLEKSPSKTIIPFSEALKKKEKDDYLMIYIYLFKDYNEQTQANIFQGLREVIGFYKDRIDKIEMHIEIYDEQYFKNADVDTFDYCFGGTFNQKSCFETENLGKWRQSLELHITDFENLPTDEELKIAVRDMAAIQKKMNIDTGKRDSI
jgi:hypothetical protein